MAYSYVTYTGDGSTAVFSVPFPYMERKDIQLITNTDDPDNGSITNSVVLPESAYEWLSDASVHLLIQVPSEATTLRIQRLTEKIVPVVDYRDGSILSERDLDLTVTQLLYIAQEAFDALDGESAVAAKEQAYKYLLECQRLYDETLAVRNELYNLSFSAHVSPNGNAAVEYTPETGMLHLYLPTVIGPQGPSGVQGLVGQTGKQGIQGSEGPQGKHGERGPQGQQGKQGIQGPAGAQGERGMQGTAAPAGAQGEKGPMGDSPWSMAFGQFRLEGAALVVDYAGTMEAQDFYINPETGQLEVTL